MLTPAPVHCLIVSTMYAAQNPSLNVIHSQRNEEANDYLLIHIRHFGKKAQSLSEPFQVLLRDSLMVDAFTVITVKNGFLDPLALHHIHP
jgi:hypothetical protein